MLRAVSVMVRGLPLFSFASHQDWINTAKRKFRASGHTCDTAICVDVDGKICTCGKQFADAKYPVFVHAIDNAPYKPSGEHEEREWAEC